MNVQTHKEKGFTIIEVVLVLAIAALIFLMVFIALPALQRSQRDTARKSDASSVAAAVTSYTSANRGSFPSTAQLATYVSPAAGKGEVSNNTTTITVYTTNVTGNKSPAAGLVAVYKGAKCNTVSNSNANLVAGTAAQFVVVTKLESGNGQYFCLDS